MKNRKYSIFDRKGNIINTEFPVRTICEMHRQMAYTITELDLSEEDKIKLLDQLDEAYDAGKRMGLKLKEYYQQTKKRWYEDFYNE